MKKLKRLISLALVCFMIVTADAGSIFAAELPEENKPLVNYLLVQEPYLETPGKQTVMIGIGDGSAAIDSAVLTYRNEQTDRMYETEATEILNDFVLFEMEYTNDSDAGTYRLEEISYSAEGTKSTASFKEMGIEASFGVDRIAENEPDDVFLSDEEVEALAAESEMSIVSLDENGKPVSGETLEEALEEAGCSAEEGLRAIQKGAAKTGAEFRGMKSLVVVLDAGHGGSDPGAQKNGIVEKTVNLKIAQYCKEELGQYAGIVVYMTRNSDTYLTLAQRAQVAINKKADLFVSLHNNSNESSGPNGANVYYPNSNYNANVGKTGMELASIIESKLTDLGLASGGIHIRNSENNTRYPDGSLADYYGVIKRCKEYGIPGLIVEHAFISNAGDAQKYLSSDASLKKLGIADATGIAEYFGLKKGLGFNSILSSASTTMDLTWTQVKNVTGYCISRSTQSGSGFQEVARVSPATKTSWKDTGLTPGVTYYYKIRTYTKSGSDIKYGKYSPVASGTTMIRPVISSIKSKNSKALVISWNTVNNAANYEIYRATKKNGTYSRIAMLTGINRVSYTDTKVKAGKKYFYKIRSAEPAGGSTIYSDYSDIVAARTAKIPSGVAVKSQASNTLRVSWKADKNAAGYVIKRADSAGGKYKKVGTASGGTTGYYDDATVKLNKTYYYKVQAFNYNDGVKGVSGYGSAASGKTIRKTSITKIANLSPTSQKISWKKAKDVDGYIVYQSTSQNGGYKKIKTIKSAKTTSLKVSNLVPGTRYFYKVRTRKKVKGKYGYGSYSAVRNVWTANTPKITAVTGNSGSSTEVFWEPSGGAERYDIYRAASANGSYQKIASVADTAVSYIDRNLNMTQQYFYKIEAYIKGYKTASVKSMSAAAGGSPVSVTSLTSAAPDAGGKLAIAWKEVKDITGYQIYRSTEENGAYTLLETISNPSVTVYTDASAAAGTSYYYKIVLVNKYNGQTVYGQYSDAVRGVLPAPVSPEAP